MRYILGFIFILLFGAGIVKAALPATLSLDPTSQEVVIDQNVDIALQIFTDNELVISTDALIKYDPTMLEPISGVTPDALFDTVSSKEISKGLFYVYALQETQSNAQPMVGTIAKLHFKPIREGNTTVEFVCEPSIKQSSAIIKSDSELSNIINCDATQTHTAQISIKGGAVLGAQTSFFSPMVSIAFVILMIGITGYLFLRYRFSTVKK